MTAPHQTSRFIANLRQARLEAAANVGKIYVEVDDELIPAAKPLPKPKPAHKRPWSRPTAQVITFPQRRPWAKPTAPEAPPWEVGPAGPVWEAAARERNWATIRIVPKPGTTKSAKVPIDPATKVPRKGCGHEQAACLTLVEALDLVSRLDALGRYRHVLGYMPRPGSAMVCGDVDECALENGGPPYWLRDLSGDLPTYVERSPSGVGLRVLMARAPATRHVEEAGGIALYADAGKALTITFDQLTESLSGVEVAWETQQAFWREAAAAERRANGAARRAERRYGEGEPWFQDLPEAHRVELVEQMLAALPDGAGADRGAWWRIACAVHDGVGEDGWPALDAWSATRAGGNYNHADNLKIWNSIKDGNRKGNKRTIGSLIAAAQVAGWQKPLRAAECARHAKLCLRLAHITGKGAGP